jgi:hypothetical protein
MLKLGKIEIALDKMAYFGIQSPLLKAHNLAHFINKFFEIELTKTLDFESYTTEQRIDFSCYTYASEAEQCSYHLIGNKHGNTCLFSNYPEMDFWFLVQFENGLNDHRFLALKEKLYKDLTQVEGVFSVIEANAKKLANFKDFEIDFLEYDRKLLHERRSNVS